MSTIIDPVNINQDTFGSLVDKVNELITAMSTEVLTANPIVGVTGYPEVRNSVLYGSYGSNNLFVANTLNGGYLDRVTGAPVYASLYMGTNTVYTSNVYFANGAVVDSNVVFEHDVTVLGTFTANIAFPIANSSYAGIAKLVNSYDSGATDAAPTAAALQHVYQMVSSGSVISITAGSGLGGGTITSSGTISVNAQTGLIANSSGLYAKLSDSLTNNDSTTAASSAAVKLLHDAIISAGTGSVTLVDGGSGLYGTVTTSGSLAVGQSNGIIVYQDSVGVQAGAGIIANTTGVHVNPPAVTGGVFSTTVLPYSSLGAAGIVQLEESVVSTSISNAATANSAKTAYDRASLAYNTAISANNAAAAASAAASAAYSLAQYGANWTQSLSGNGWVKFPDGIIIQWGTDSQVENYTANVHTTYFTTTFSAPPFVVNMSRNSPIVEVYNMKHYQRYGTPTTQYFQWYVSDDDSGNAGLYVRGFDWIAIGY